MSLSMSEFTDEEEDNKESDVDFESNSEAENKRRLAKYKVREKSCNRRPIAGRPRGRSYGDASHCLGDGKRANSKLPRSKIKEILQMTLKDPSGSQ